MGFSRISQVIFIVALWTSVSIGFKDYDILKFTLNQMSDVPAMGSLKMFRAERRTFKFNVTLNITTDDLSTYDVEAQLFRSAIGNNQFVVSPFKVPRKPLCDLFNNEYREWVMDQLAQHSNLPLEHDKKVNYCDLLKLGNVYEVINYHPDVSKVPKYAATGVYKFFGNVIDRNTNEIALSAEVITKLY